MNNDDFKRAFALADSDENLSLEDIDIFHGCALPGFSPVVATIRQVARIIRWQAANMGGGWDAEELTSLRDIFRRKVTMVG